VVKFPSSLALIGQGVAAVFAIAADIHRESVGIQALHLSRTTRNFVVIDVVVFKLSSSKAKDVVGVSKKETPKSPKTPRKG
jgi:hypothetical protein